MIASASFAKRGVYYASEAYSDQLAAGQGYGKLRSTYAVCLLIRPIWQDPRLHAPPFSTGGKGSRSSCGRRARDSHGRVVKVQWERSSCHQSGVGRVAETKPSFCGELAAAGFEKS